MKYADTIQVVVGSGTVTKWRDYVSSSDRRSRRDYEVALNEQIHTEAQRVGGAWKIQNLRILTDEQMHALSQIERAPEP